MFLCVTSRGRQVSQGLQDFQVRRDKKAKRSVQMVLISCLVALNALYFFQLLWTTLLNTQRAENGDKMSFTSLKGSFLCCPQGPMGAKGEPGPKVPLLKISGVRQWRRPSLNSSNLFSRVKQDQMGSVYLVFRDHLDLQVPLSTSRM